MDEVLQTTIETLLVLLVVIFVVALFVQRVRLPYTVALVLIGLLGFQPGFRDIHLTPDLILEVFLPVLLFEGAYNVNAQRLRHELLPVTLLAVPGVLVGTLVTGAIVHYALALSWGIALLFGALIASTDPIAVVSLFRELGVPRRLALLVEGESLLNDGASITIFQIILAAVVTGEFSIGMGIGRFLLTVAGALAVGAVIGYGGSRLLRVTDSAQIQITATVVAAYGAYLVAEQFTFSGAIAVVVTALLFGNYGSTSGLNPQSVHAISATWDFLGFVANSLVFLLIGIEMDPLTIVRNWWIIAIAFAASIVGRGVVVYLLVPLLHGVPALRRRWAIPYKFMPVLLWGGLRGAVSLALVLSIPLALPNGQPFPDRNLLLLIAFGVVGASLLLQGLTMRPLIRRLGLMSDQTTGDEAASLEARLAAIEGALLVLSREHERGEVSALEYSRLSNAYQYEHAQVKQQLDQIRQAEDEQEEREEQTAREPAKDAE